MNSWTRTTFAVLLRKIIIVALVVTLASGLAAAEPLHDAVSGFNISGATIKRLLSSGADPNAKNSEGDTPLHILGRRPVPSSAALFGDPALLVPVRKLSSC